jgi:hypothetical protein
MRYDLAVAWITKTDALFIELLDRACQVRGQSLLQITPVNLEIILTMLRNDMISIRALLDRSSDEDERFLPLGQWVHEHEAIQINPREEALHARDKAWMHLKLFQDLRTPYTIILPPYNEQPDLEGIDLSPLGATFTTKPSTGGGGEGVIVLCTSVDEIQPARRQFPDDKYLLQARVVPVRLGKREAWFRVVYSFGKIYPFWWSTKTHLYGAVTLAERYHYNLEVLEEMTAKIAGICRLHLFSTEIALTAEGSFQVIDYVNDPLDLTPRSKIVKCVPDKIIGFIAEDLAAWLAVRLKEREREEPEMEGQPL